MFVNQTYMLGEDVTLECNSDGGPNNTYQWQANGTDIEEQTSQTLVLTNVYALDGGLYTCVVSNEAGSDEASTFVFIFPYFITHPLDRVVFQSGLWAQFRCVAEGFPVISYSWGRADGGTIRPDLDTDRTSLLFRPASYGDEGIYYCNVSNIFYTIQSEATLTSASGQNT